MQILFLNYCYYIYCSQVMWIPLLHGLTKLPGVAARTLGVLQRGICTLLAEGIQLSEFCFSHEAVFSIFHPCPLFLQILIFLQKTKAIIKMFSHTYASSNPLSRKTLLLFAFKILCFNS